MNDDSAAGQRGNNFVVLILSVGWHRKNKNRRSAS
jgi:hypothetical protein